LDKGQIYFKDLNKYLITRVNGDTLVFDLVRALVKNNSIWEDKEKLLNAIFNEMTEEADISHGTWRLYMLGNSKRKEILDKPLERDPPMRVIIDNKQIEVYDWDNLEFSGDFYEFIVFFRNKNSYYWCRNQVLWG